MEAGRWRGLSKVFRLGLAALSLPAAAVASYPAGDLEARDRAPGVRLNQIQVIGTHNSYHLEPYPGILELKYSELLQRPPAATRGATERYRHLPLRDQLEKERVRQLELDLYPDPQGGLFQDPLGFQLARLRGVKLPDDGRAAVMAKPGIKVMHTPDFDFHSNTLTLQAGLREIRAWSREHPRHVPVFILLELKYDAEGPNTRLVKDAAVKRLFEHRVREVEWDEAQFAAMEREILDVFPRGEIITPDDVRGTSRTLREAVLARGWPELDAVRGRVMFWMDGEGEIRDRYLGRSGDLRGRLLFVSVGADHPAAAYMALNDPDGDFDHIQDMVRKGFLVRTMADHETREARAGDVRRRDRALASGAQCISTDFPVRDPRYTDYEVRLPNGAAARMDPIAAGP